MRCWCRALATCTNQRSCARCSMAYSLSPTSLHAQNREGQRSKHNERLRALSREPAIQSSFHPLYEPSTAPTADPKMADPSPTTGTHYITHHTLIQLTPLQTPKQPPHQAQLQSPAPNAAKPTQPSSPATNATQHRTVAKIAKKRISNLTRKCAQRLRRST